MDDCIARLPFVCLVPACLAANLSKVSKKILFKEISVILFQCVKMSTLLIYYIVLIQGVGIYGAG